MTCSLRLSALGLGHVVCALLVLCVVSTNLARAEDVTLSSSALSNPRPAPSTALLLSSPRAPEPNAYTLSEPTFSPSSAKRDERKPRFTSPMPYAGVGLKLGVAGTRAGERTFDFDENYRFESRTDKRLGLHLSVPIYLGGKGFGWVFEPMLQKSSVSHALKDNLGRIVGAEDVGVLGLGMYTGPQVQIHASNALYLGIGLGAKVLYLANDAFEYAFDVYGRAPLTVTYYVHQHLAFICELGLGYGISVFADAPRPMLDTTTGIVRNVSDDPEVGSAFAWDFTFGVRLP